MSSRPKVLLLHEVPHGGDENELADALLDRIPDLNLAVARSYEHALEEAEDAAVVVGRSLPPELLSTAGELSWVQALSAGVDSYDLDELERRGIVLTNASGVHANPIAEQVLAYALLFERNLLRGIRRQRRNEWRHFPGGELRGRTVGIVGLGSIGRRVAELASGFDTGVIGTKRDADVELPGVKRVYPPAETHVVVGEADYLVLCCPLTDETRGLVGPDELASMPTDAVLINVARGEVVDEDALAYALQKNKIRGAALDVQREEPLPADSPLWNLENVVITPHMAGSTPHYWERSADIFERNYRAFVGDSGSYENRIL